MKNSYKVFIVGLFLIFTLGNTKFKTPSTEQMKQIGYQISTCVYQDKKGSIWVFETIMNKKTGQIVSRKQVHSKKYKNIK